MNDSDIKDLRIALLKVNDLATRIIPVLNDIMDGTELMLLRRLEHGMRYPSRVIVDDALAALDEHRKTLFHAWRAVRDAKEGA